MPPTLEELDAKLNLLAPNDVTPKIVPEGTSAMTLFPAPFLPLGWLITINLVRNRFRYTDLIKS